MQTDEPLVNDTFLLQKYPGKGGWTYTILPESIRKKKTPFGWLQVSGFIDEFELKAYRLMPMSSGKLFLPVRAEVRKKIGKQAGDWVRVILYVDSESTDTREELLLCLQDSKEAYNNFLLCSETEQQAFVNYIDGAKNEETRVRRLAQSVDVLETGDKL